LTDLLSSEERSALQEPFGKARTPARVVTRAEFPSVSQLDSELTDTLNAGIKRWMDKLADELSTQMQAPCLMRSLSPDTVSGESLVRQDDERFWGRLEGRGECGVLLSLPVPFAGAICERIFGAPLQSAASRPLTPAEKALLRDLARTWLTLFGYAWKGTVIRFDDALDGDRVERDPSAGSWMRFSGTIVCGPVEGAVSLAMTPTTARHLLGNNTPAEEAQIPSHELAEHLGEIPVELSVLLGRAEFTLDELASLQVGDIIALERATPDPVEIIVDERVFARARAGLSGQRVAFEILDEPTEENEL
jgi:flagellar motor switch protein FliM